MIGNNNIALVINPPTGGPDAPAAPPEVFLRAAACLRSAGWDVLARDLDLERRLSLWKVGGGEKAATALKALRSGGFHAPAEYWRAKEALAGALAQEPGSGERESLLEEALWDELAACKAGLAVIAAHSPSQAGASALMARRAGRRCPEARVCILGKGLAAPGEQGASVLAGVPEFKKWLKGLGPAPTGGGSFSGLDWDAYPAPSLVAPCPAASLLPADRVGAMWWDEKEPIPLTGVPLAVTRTLDLGHSGLGVDELSARGVRLIRWLIPVVGREVEVDQLLELRVEQYSSLLARSAKAGIWNHLELPAGMKQGAVRALTRYAELFPNLVHSRAEAGRPWPKKEEGLAGVPFWALAGDLNDLLLMLGQMEREKLRRLRLGEAGEIYTLGEELDFYFKKPQEMTGGMFERVARLIAAGEKTPPGRVLENLKRAYLICYVLDHGEMVGTETLKRPRKEYIDMISEKTGLNLEGYVERGYVSVLPHYRGMGMAGRMVAGLMKRSRDVKTYLSIPNENLAAIVLSKRHGRTRRVTAYFSDKLQKEFGIWMPADQEPDWVNDA